MLSSLESIVDSVLDYHFSKKRGAYKQVPASKAEKEAPPDSVDRFVLDQGGPVWSVYSAAKTARSVKKKSPQQDELSEKLESLDAQSIDARKRFAQLLANKVNNMSNPGNNESMASQAKRPRVNTENDDTDQETDELIRRQAKRPRVNTENDDADLVQLNTTAQSINTLSNNCVPQQIPDPNDPKRDDLYLGASLPLAKPLFSPTLWKMIRRIPHKESSDEMRAEMSTFFHENGNRYLWGCQIEIGIAKEHIVEIALLLYDTLITTVNGVRSHPHSGESGSRIECTESFILRGCRRDLPMFKGLLYEGICASPLYKREEKEARDTTDAVSMRIPSRENLDATIMIHVGEWKATKIVQSIYTY